MKILVVDGQGGKLGAQIITLILNNNYKDLDLLAIGTNAIATQVMIKAGAVNAATGENPVVCNAVDQDIIIGPIGIVIADSLYGEVTSKMAQAIGQSKALKVLIPINKCNNIVVGVNTKSMNDIFSEIIKTIDSFISK